MTAQCFAETCSLTWRTATDPDLGPQYVGDVRYDANSSLFCDQPSGGMDVKVLPYDADGGNWLQKDASGNLFVGIPSALRIVRNDDATTGGGAVPMRGIGTTTDDEASSPSSFAGGAAFSVANPFATTALMIVTAEMQFGWSVNPSGPKISPSSGPDLNIFNGQFVYRLNIDGEVACQERISASGMVDVSQPTGQHKKDYRSLAATRVLAIGETVAFEDACWNEGHEQRIGIITTASQAAPVRGFRTSRVRALLIPLPGA